MILDYAVEIMVGLGIPAIGAVYFIARYIHSKEKCLTLLKAKVESMDEDNTQDRQVHLRIKERIIEIDRRMTKIESDMAYIRGKLDAEK